MTDTPSPLQRPLAVQIGFNKCATLSLTRLFNRSGVKSLHCNWPGRRKDNTAPPYQLRIQRNLKNGKPAFAGLDQFSGFFDLELIRPQRHFENFKQFRTIAATYPNARFILNTRDKIKWLRSRARHTDGLYLAKYMALYDESEDLIFARWARDFDIHHAAVRDYFSDKPERLVEFNIDTDDISKVVKFFSETFELDPTSWEHVHKTNDKSWAQKESDDWDSFDFQKYA